MLFDYQDVSGACGLLDADQRIDFVLLIMHKREPVTREKAEF